MLKLAGITPHPPIIVPGVGSEKDLTEVADTIDAMTKMAESLNEKDIDTVVIITPHGTLEDKFNVYDSKRFTSSLPGALLNFDGNPDLADKICEIKDAKKLESGKLDHGTSVPMHFFQEKNPKIKVVPITYSTKDKNKHFEFGKKLIKKINQQEERIALIASGDLSHKLKPSAPAGFSEKGKKFDEKLIKLLKNREEKKVLKINEELIKEAGQCGYKSIIILLGALSQTKHSPEFLSYEGPFGVGYGVLRYNIENDEN